MTVPQDKEEEIEMKVTLTLLFMEFGLVLFGLIISMECDAKIEASGAWLLDEAKGDKVEDVSGNGISGEIRGDYKYVQGQFGEALEFNGQNTLVLFENDNPAQAFVLHRDKDVSLVFWVKPFSVEHKAIFWTRGDGIDADRFNIHSGGGPTFGFDYREVDGNIHQGLYQNVALLTNVWTHLAITRDGNTYSTYNNGNLVSRGKDQNPALPQATSWMMSGRPGFIFDGNIDDVAFFESALSRNDITNIMENGLEIAALAVEPSDKLATAWARLKSSR